jgi:hypothetical protein
MRFLAPGLVVLTMGTLVTACTQPAAQPASHKLIVNKTPTCGCCEKWVAHMRDAGFTVEVRNMSDTSGEREKAGVPPELSSCHTALVGGYAIEGHVPADLVHKLLKERPKITGLAVGGMPVGSPGMEQPGFEERYEVTAFDRSGKRSVYARR